VARTPTQSEIQKARLLALVMPAAERHELERRYAVRPALLSAGLGVLELALGIALYAWAHPPYGGIVGWLLWHANPITWFAMLIITTGILRGVNYLANNDSFGEPLVWCFVRLWQGRRNAVEAKHVRQEFGPERRDRVVVDDDGALVLLASRAKRDWDEYRTVRIEDEFFKIEAVEERRAGRHMAVAYVLREVPESEVLRGIVHTDAKLPANAPPADAEAADPSDSS